LDVPVANPDFCSTIATKSDITWNELTVGFDQEKSDALLSDWRWLVGDEAQLLVFSALGDLFLGDAEGHIFWLNTGAARLTRIAESAEEFKRLMQQAEHADEWFFPQLVGDLIASGKRLAPGQCYSYKVPPMLSGKMELDNFDPTDLLVHCSMFGQIARQIRDLPEGAKINGFTTVKDDDA
jgi:hypothetical protein